MAGMDEQVLGITCFILTLTFAFRLASLVFRSRDIGLLATIVLGTNYTFSASASGGMETQ